MVGVDDTMLEDLHDRDSAIRLHQLIRERLTAREAEIIRLRYGLGGTVPLTQRGGCLLFRYLPDLMYPALKSVLWKNCGQGSAVLPAPKAPHGSEQSLFADTDTLTLPNDYYQPQPEPVHSGHLECDAVLRFTCIRYIVLLQIQRGLF